MPKPATGGNAVVYKATLGQSAWAVRCFLRPISDHAERYAAISKHLQKNRSAHSTEFVYLADGLRIKGGTFPIVKMAWVQGQHLDRCVEGLLDQPRELAGLRERFATLVKDIERAKFAHGDLQHGNILFTGKDLLLIDYDGMWVPALIGRQATEIGHRAYQHPKRSMTDYGPYLDRFSALVIYLSLLALEVDHKLWDQYYTGDNLLFVREDFNEPGKSPIWGDLAALRHRDVSYLAGVLAAMVGRPVKDLPRLESVLSKSGGLKPLQLKAGAPQGCGAGPQVCSDLPAVHRGWPTPFRGDEARRVRHLGTGHGRLQAQQRPPAAVRAVGHGRGLQQSQDRGDHRQGRAGGRPGLGDQGGAFGRGLEPGLGGRDDGGCGEGRDWPEPGTGGRRGRPDGETAGP